jgi:hypothetical protein
MNATNIIIAAILSLQVSFLYAGNNETRPVVNDETVLCPTCMLAPITPIEATFEEITLPSAFNFDFTTLLPVTPVEADFSDIVPEKNLNLTILAPVTPAKADFNENIDTPAFNLSVLAPVTPSDADFE